MKRTFQPSVLKRKRNHAHARMATKVAEKLPSPSSRPSPALGVGLYRLVF